MDSIDQKIIRELQMDARLTNQELAKKVNLSPSPCLRRVRNLEKSGVLTGYTAQVDEEQYGLPISVFISIRLEKQDDSSIKKFETRINDLDEILECYLMAGNRDYLLRVVSADLKSYEKFIRDKLTRLPGISSIESSFAFGNVKRRNVFPPMPRFEQQD